MLAPAAATTSSSPAWLRGVEAALFKLAGVELAGVELYWHEAAQLDATLLASETPRLRGRSPLSPGSGGSDASSLRPSLPARSKSAGPPRPGDVRSSRMHADERRGVKRETSEGRRSRPDETAEVSRGIPKPEPRRPSLAWALTMVPPVWKPARGGWAAVARDTGR